MKAIARKVVANLVNRKAGTKTANYNTSTNDLYEMLRTTAPDVFQRFDTGYPKSTVYNAGLAIARKGESQQNELVYIIGNRIHGFCKIGRTKKLKTRLADLQVGCPYELDILATFQNKGAPFEQLLHERAAPYHIRGEWFRIEGRLKEFLNNTDKSISR